jgi:hypothetical protein
MQERQDNVRKSKKRGFTRATYIGMGQRSEGWQFRFCCAALCFMRGFHTARKKRGQARTKEKMGTMREFIWRTGKEKLPRSNCCVGGARVQSREGACSTLRRVRRENTRGGRKHTSKKQIFTQGDIPKVFLYFIKALFPLCLLVWLRKG